MRKIERYHPLYSRKPRRDAPQVLVHKPPGRVEEPSKSMMKVIVINYGSLCKLIERIGSNS
jgi:hypothetical protein